MGVEPKLNCVITYIAAAAPLRTCLRRLPRLPQVRSPCVGNRTPTNTNDLWRGRSGGGEVEPHTRRRYLTNKNGDNVSTATYAGYVRQKTTYHELRTRRMSYNCWKLGGLRAQCVSMVWSLSDAF